MKVEPWNQLVADAGPGDHIVQLYQDEDFLNRAVCRFAGSTIVNGEGLILVPTLSHWDAFRPRLEAEGVDVEAAQRRGQLTIVDADECLPRFIREGMPDSPVFLGLAEDVIDRAHAGGRYPKVRWWGEMVVSLGTGERGRQHGPRRPVRSAWPAARRSRSSALSSWTTLTAKFTRTCSRGSERTTLTSFQ